MTQKQFPTLEFTRVNAKGTCREYSQASTLCECWHQREIALKLHPDH